MANTELQIPSLGDKFIDYRQPIWGNSFTWSWERPFSQVQYIVFHHSVTDHDATPDDIALIHKARGWAGVGYHFIITKDGRVWYVGDISTARAHVKDMNEKVIGICMIGDFTKHLPSDAQINSGHLLASFLLKHFSQLKGWAESVKGHKDLQATACPGTSWNGELGGMKDRLEKNIPYTPPEPIKEVYRVVFQGATLAEYDENPVDKITTFNTQLATYKDTNAKLTQKNADLEFDYNEQAEELRILKDNLGKATTARDNALSAVDKLEKQIVKLNEDKVQLQVKLDAKAPLENYKGLALIWKGFRKAFLRQKILS